MSKKSEWVHLRDIVDYPKGLINEEELLGIDEEGNERLIVYCCSKYEWWFEWEEKRNHIPPFKIVKFRQRT